MIFRGMMGPYDMTQACARPLVRKSIKEDPKNGPHNGDTLSNFSPSDTSVTKVRERARQGAGLCGYFVGSRTRNWVV